MRVTTPGEEPILRAHAIPGMWTSLFRLGGYGPLVAAFVRRDITARYKGSAGGILWSLVNPLVTLLLFWFLFSGLLKVKVGAEEGTDSFFLYLVCGMLPWMAFQETLARAAGVVLEYRSLVKRTVFPSEVLPLV